MKLCCVVVLYNPDDCVIDNLKTYYDLFDKVFVINNSSQEMNDFFESLKSFHNIEVVEMHGNKGIAKALKVGMEQAISHSYDWCLTMDQDSQFPTDKFEQICSLLKDKEEAGILCLDFNQAPGEIFLQRVRDCITSGSFVNVKKYQLIDGFHEELFIDWVDYDLCYQFFQNQIPVFQIRGISISHQIGSPLKKKILGKTFFSSNHSPIRYYYQFRNGYYLYHQDKKYYFKLYFHLRFVVFLKVLFYEPKKCDKIKMMRLGIKHGKQKKLGELQKEC